MRAWLVPSFGAEPTLGATVDPIPAKGEIIVRVEAVGLNFADMLAIQGKYQVRHPMPYVPGMEFSGIVDALGPGVTALPPGSRVLGTCVCGALADLICVPQARLSALPDTMTFEEAAGFPTAPFDSNQ